MNTAVVPHLSRIDLPNAGSIGMMPCPGRSGDLTTEISAMKAIGVDLLLSLMQENEYPDLAAFDAAMSLNRIKWVRVPLVPGGVPIDVPEWTSIRAMLLERIRHGDFVAIHCWGGLGRTGVVAADLLKAFGFDSGEAISHVREVRPGTIESETQELWLKRANSA